MSDKPIMQYEDAGKELPAPSAPKDDDWIRMAGSIIDTVHLTPEDYVNEKLVEQLKRYFGGKR